MRCCLLLLPIILLCLPACLLYHSKWILKQTFKQFIPAVVIILFSQYPLIFHAQHKNNTHFSLTLHSTFFVFVCLKAISHLLLEITFFLEKKNVQLEKTFPFKIIFHFILQFFVVVVVVICPKIHSRVFFLC